MQFWCSFVEVLMKFWWSFDEVLKKFALILWIYLWTAKVAMNLPRSAGVRPLDKFSNWVAINLPRSAGSWSLLVGAEKWPWTCQGRQVESPRSMGAENRPSTCQGRQVEITGLKTGHQPAKVGRLRTSLSSWIGSMAEKWPWTCQGRQVEDKRLTMAENRPSTCQGRQVENVAINLPRSAGWVHKKKCGSTCQGRQVYGHFFNLPHMAGVPKWLESIWRGYIIFF